jgi:hypothetical protein
MGADGFVLVSDILKHEKVHFPCFLLFLFTILDVKSMIIGLFYCC